MFKPSRLRSIFRFIFGISRLAVYTPNEKRNVVMALQVPEGISLTPGGTLSVSYRATEDEGGQVLAEQSIRLK